MCHEIVSSCWYKLLSPQRSVPLYRYSENELCLIKTNECFDKCKLHPEIQVCSLSVTWCYIWPWQTIREKVLREGCYLHACAAGNWHCDGTENIFISGEKCLLVKCINNEQQYNAVTTFLKVHRLDFEKSKNSYFTQYVVYIHLHGVNPN